MAERAGVSFVPLHRDINNIDAWLRHTNMSRAEFYDDLYSHEKALSSETLLDPPEERRPKVRRTPSMSSRKHIPSPPRPERVPFRKRDFSPHQTRNRSLDMSSPPKPQLRHPYPDLDPSTGLSLSPSRSDDDTDASVEVAEQNRSSPGDTKQTIPTNGFNQLDSEVSTTMEKFTPKAPFVLLKSSLKPSKPFGRFPSTNSQSLEDNAHQEISENHDYPETQYDTSDSLSEASPPNQERSFSVYRPSSLTLSSSTLRESLSQSSSGVLGDKVYRYSELQEHEFRLVKILPARMSTIKCEMFHASLKNPPSYMAISYAWGDAVQIRRIQLDGVMIPVSVSLHSALEAVREKKESILVWIDALSIDQFNRSERTQQVRLMRNIYTKAEVVAIWLGSETDDSGLAVSLIKEIAAKADSPAHIRSLITSNMAKPAFVGIVALFERNYWRRLWVVQEVSNARRVMVYCGFTKVPWTVYQTASRVFRQYRGELDDYFHGSSSYGTSQHQFTYSQVLVHQGPSSLPDVRSHMLLGDEESFLEVMCACRRKLCADPRDKVFGILGVLPEAIRSEFPMDYNQSVKEVYINAIDYILATTERLDVICESIHFPLHTNSADLPTWVPDWSHIPETASLGRMCKFSAADNTTARCNLIDERRKLEVTAIPLDTISVHGIAVGTLCTLADYLMAFLHWRALLLRSESLQESSGDIESQRDFCRTLCLDQVPSGGDGKRDWLSVCYHVFASLILDRLPSLPLDRQLRRYADMEMGIKAGSRRQFLQENFGGRMMGRCFCLTEGGRMGMGTGFMTPGDLIVVPLGCSTPILIRPQGRRGEYRFVGDVYIHGYMHGKAMDDWNWRMALPKYIIH
jgi:hypothetical protein